MPPRPLLLLGAACVLALGCAAHLPYYQQSLELSASGNDLYAPGSTQDRIAGALEARHYTVQDANMRAPRYASPLYAGTMTPWGVRIRSDGWDQIDVIRTGGPAAHGLLPLAYHWTVRARTFAWDGVERPASADAQADVDSILSLLGTVDEARRALEATRPAPPSPPDSTGPRLRACAGGSYVGTFTALPPWAGAREHGSNAERIAAKLAAGGWTIERGFPYASLGTLVARRAQPDGADVVSVAAFRFGDPSYNGVDIRTRYEVRTASCDSAGRRGPPRAETRADADRLVVALRDAVSGER
jgi:hypothetical protein